MYAGPADVAEKLETTAAGQEKVLSLLEVISSLQLDEFMYTEGKISRKSDPAAAAFSSNIKSSYHALASHGMCWCLLTDAP